MLDKNTTKFIRSRDLNRISSLLDWISINSTKLACGKSENFNDVLFYSQTLFFELKPYLDGKNAGKVEEILKSCFEAVEKFGRSGKRNSRGSRKSRENAVKELRKLYAILIEMKQKVGFGIMETSEENNKEGENQGEL